MNAQINPPSNSQSPQYLDLNTLKQRRFQHKIARQNFTDNSNDETYQSHNNTMPLRSQQPDACLSDRAHRAVPRVQTYLPMTPTLTRAARDRSAPVFHETCNEQLFSEPSQQVILANNKNTSPPLTPLKPSTMILLNETNENDAESVENEGNTTPKMHTLKRAPMTPEGKSYSDSSIFQKDLISYRVARQMARSPGGPALLMRSHSLRETSNSLERSHSEYQRNTERSNTMFENDRKGHIMGLERFYNRNMQVLEEDEGHSDEFERENSRERKGSNGRNRPLTSQPNLKAKVRDNKSGVNNKMQDRTTRGQKKFGNPESVDRKLVTERPNTANVTSRYNAKKEVKETVKAVAGSSSKKLEEQLQKNKLQKTFEEEQIKITVTQEDNRQSRNLTPSQSQTTVAAKPQAVPTKRLQLTNWNKTAHFDSAHSSNRNSPRSRQKELFAATQPIKKMMASPDSPKKAVESKVAKLFKKSTTVQYGPSKNVSAGNTAVFDEPEQIVNIVSNTVAAVNSTIAALTSNVKDNKATALAAAAVNKVDVKTLKLPLSKDLNEKGDLSRLPLKSSETDRDRKKSQERDSTTRENTKRKESLVKVASEGSDHAGTSTPANNNAKKTYTIVKKATYDNAPSPISNKRANNKETSEPPKTPSRTVKHSGMSSTGNLKKMTDAVANNNLANPMSHYLGKLKSPNVQPGKAAEKSVDVSKESKGATINKHIAPSKWSRSPKESRANKQSIDFRNLDEIKLPANIVENKAKSMEVEGLFITEKEVKESQQPVNKTPQRKVSMDKKEEKKEAEVKNQEAKKPESKTSPNLKVRPDLLKALGLPFLINGKNL